MKKLLIVAAVLSLAGCKSAADRMYECQAQGISRDACYIAEQNRQATINATAEKQAMENAQALYSSEGKHHHRHTNQYAQSAKKPAIQVCESLDGLVKIEGVKGMSSDQMRTFNICHPGVNARWEKLPTGYTIPMIDVNPFGGKTDDLLCAKDVPSTCK